MQRGNQGEIPQKEYGGYVPFKNWDEVPENCPARNALETSTAWRRGRGKSVYIDIAICISKCEYIKDRKKAGYCEQAQRQFVK